MKFYTVCTVCFFTINYWLLFVVTRAESCMERSATPSDCCLCQETPPVFQCLHSCKLNLYQVDRAAVNLQCNPRSLIQTDGKTNASTSTSAALVGAVGVSRGSNNSTKHNSSNLNTTSDSNSKEPVLHYDPRTEILCKPCHEACERCNGPGPNDCLTFFLSSTESNTNTTGLSPNISTDDTNTDSNVISWPSLLPLTIIAILLFITMILILSRRRVLSLKARGFKDGTAEPESNIFPLKPVLGDKAMYLTPCEEPYTQVEKGRGISSGLLASLGHKMPKERRLDTESCSMLEDQLSTFTDMDKPNRNVFTEHHVEKQESIYSSIEDCHILGDYSVCISDQSKPKKTSPQPFSHLFTQTDESSRSSRFELYPVDLPRYCNNKTSSQKTSLERPVCEKSKYVPCIESSTPPPLPRRLSLLPPLKKAPVKEVQLVTEKGRDALFEESVVSGGSINYLEPLDQANETHHLRRVIIRRKNPGQRLMTFFKRWFPTFSARKQVRQEQTVAPPKINSPTTSNWTDNLTCPGCGFYVQASNSTECGCAELQSSSSPASVSYPVRSRATVTGLDDKVEQTETNIYEPLLPLSERTSAQQCVLPSVPYHLFPVFDYLDSFSDGEDLKERAKETNVPCDDTTSNSQIQITRQSLENILEPEDNLYTPPWRNRYLPIYSWRSREQLQLDQFPNNEYFVYKTPLDKSPPSVSQDWILSPRFGLSDVSIKTSLSDKEYTSSVSTDFITSPLYGLTDLFKKESLSGREDSSSVFTIKVDKLGGLIEEPEQLFWCKVNNDSTDQSFRSDLITSIPVSLPLNILPSEKMTICAHGASEVSWPHPKALPSERSPFDFLGLQPFEHFMKASGSCNESENFQTNGNLAAAYNVTSSTQTPAPEFEEMTEPSFCPVWQAEQTFSSLGGSLQTENSDVRLEIPAGAVPRGDSITVKVAICTDLDKVYSKLHSSDFPKRDYIASPVAGYFAGTGVRFKKPVRIVLPHFLPPNLCVDQVSVYVLCDDHMGCGPNLQKLVLLTKEVNTEVTQPGVFCIGPERCVVIYTNHFSDYFCSYCQTKREPQDLNVVAFAGERKIRGRREIDVRLDIWDSRLAITDFDQASRKPNQQVSSQQHLKYIVTRSLLRPEIPSDEDRPLNIGLELELRTPKDRDVWMHCQRVDGALIYPEKQLVPIKDLMLCECKRCKVPQMSHWKLQNRGGRCEQAEEFECLMDVGYICGQPVPETAHYREVFLPHPRPLTIDVHIPLSLIEAELSPTEKASIQSEQENLGRRSEMVQQGRVQNPGQSCGSPTSETSLKRVFSTMSLGQGLDFPPTPSSNDVACRSSIRQTLHRPAGSTTSQNRNYEYWSHQQLADYNRARARRSTPHVSLSAMSPLSPQAALPNDSLSGTTLPPDKSIIIASAKTVMINTGQNNHTGGLHGAVGDNPSSHTVGFQGANGGHPSSCTLGFQSAIGGNPYCHNGVVQGAVGGNPRGNPPSHTGGFQGAVEGGFVTNHSIQGSCGNAHGDPTDNVFRNTGGFRDQGIPAKTGTLHFSNQDPLYVGTQMADCAARDSAVAAPLSSSFTGTTNPSIPEQIINGATEAIGIAERETLLDSMDQGHSVDHNFIHSMDGRFSIQRSLTPHTSALAELPGDTNDSDENSNASIYVYNETIPVQATSSETD